MPEEFFIEYTNFTGDEWYGFIPKPEEQKPVPSNRGFWEACCEYRDGTEIRKRFPYNEGGNYVLENQRQYELEEWLLSQHEDPMFYSVNYVED